MIIKRIDLRNPNVSSFAKLTEYITHSQGQWERVGTVSVTNCHTSDPWWAARDVERVQRENNRTKLDKTYHLLVSFPKGETPFPDTLVGIEQALCKGLGYDEHQRISAVHEDTDHLHVHIAINKVHPMRFTAHEPYYDKRLLGKLAEQLEEKYNLRRENHVSKMNQSAARARDMEQAAGIETLIGWVKRNLLADLLQCASWDELHQVLGQSRLALLPRGNGLVISNGLIGAKASSVDRGLSMAKLEIRLGPFRGPTARQGQTEQGERQYYQVRAMPSKVNTEGLWQRYQQEQGLARDQRANEKTQANNTRLQEIARAKNRAKLSRGTIQSFDDRDLKQYLYKEAGKRLLKDIKNINEKYRQDRISMNMRVRNLSWYDWLKQEAKQGDAESSSILLNRYNQNTQTGNTLSFSQEGHSYDARTPVRDLPIDTVTKRGTIRYRTGTQIIKDYGTAIVVPAIPEPRVVEMALCIAVRRFGYELKVSGSETFKEMIIAAAVKNHSKLVFSDLELETRRKALQRSKESTASQNQKNQSMLNNPIQQQRYGRRR